jgi:hypothetical protein
MEKYPKIFQIAGIRKCRRNIRGCEMGGSSVKKRCLLGEEGSGDAGK